MKSTGQATIKVLIVDDSQVVRELLTFILSSDPAIEVIDTASNGKEAVQAVRDRRPDVVVMDVIMPVMNGLDATSIIMEATPTPIVIVSASWSQGEVEKTFRAMEAGAVASVEKPVGVTHPHYERLARELVHTVKLMSEVKVIRRKWQAGKGTAVPCESATRRIQSMTPSPQIVAIGASTGGPQAIKVILSGLPEDFPVPLLIVQHMAGGFIQGFADWLGECSRRPVRVAVHDEYPLPGHVYVAPDDFHMGIASDARIALSGDEPENGLRPAVSHLFRSIAEVFGMSSIGVLLSGMGKDGAWELKLMKEKGATTIAQDRDSSVVYGMPGEAAAIEAASFILPPARIAQFLSGLPTGGKRISMLRGIGRAKQ